LTLFREFIRNQSDTIEALQILLNRPKDLNTNVLTELIEKLAQRPEGFTLERLRKAYDNNLVDIISMIKNAAYNQPLMPTAQRVQRAISTISEGKLLSKQEKEWLDLISIHLTYNLLIEKEHFFPIPFSIKGGWKKSK
jgi:type I restriction enzyme R subunit